jgi:hypothetical protein
MGKVEAGRVEVDLTEDHEAAQAPASDANVIVEDGPGGGKKTLPERAELMPDGSVRLKMLKPVALTIKGANGKTREETYSELVFNELSGADMRLIMQASDERKPIVGFARATGINMSVMGALFDKMGTRDINAASACISFLSE